MTDKHGIKFGFDDKSPQSLGEQMQKVLGVVFFHFPVYACDT